MGLFSKATRWVKKQTHGGLKKGLSASGLKSTFKGTIKNPVFQAGAGLALGGLGGMAISKLAPKLGGLFGGGAAGAVEGLAGGDIAGAADPGRFRSLVSGAGKFLGGNDGFGADDLLKYGKAAGDAFGAYDTHQTVDRHRKLLDAEYQAGAPLRDAARRMLLEDSMPVAPMAPLEQPRYRRVNVTGRA